MSGYTKGEWIVESSDCMTAHYVLVNAYDYFEKGYESNDPQTAIALRQEDEANARLIAAAPDLLAACEAAQIMLLQTDWNGDERLNIVHNAIAKAKP